MEFITFKKDVKGRFLFLQQMGIFIAHFAAAKWGWRAAKWHSCARGWFRSCETTCEMGVRLQKLEFLGVEDFAEHFAAAKWGEGGRGPAKWHSCAKGVFINCKKFRRGGAWGCEIISQPRGDFAAEAWFRSGYLGTAKLFCSQRPFSQGPLLGCKISQTMDFSLLLSSSWFPEIFLQFFCNSFWIRSFKKIKLHINNTT